MSFTDIAIVLGIAGVGIAIVFFLFNSVAEVPKAKRQASQVVAAAKRDSFSKKKDDEKKAQPAKPLSKKEREAQAAKEKELEELIAREAKGNKGMGADQARDIITLDDAKAKAKAAQELKRKSAGVNETKKEFTEEQKAKERAHGFKVVEAKEERKESPAAVAAVQGAAKGHSGTRRASPVAPAQAKREELEKKLGDFFKSNSRRKRDDDYTAKPAKASPSPTERVRAAKPASAGQANAWAEEREW